MKKEKLESYELFYMEIPQADYLNEIDTDIDHEPASYNEEPNLSDEQVSAIARDQLDGDPAAALELDQQDETLFTRKPSDEAA